ncbi:ABC transporter, ATP-binding protein [Gleimia coleocanis DSM 15436]|uniref:Putative hemin import ATP-binding protein HrtA n=1 Tax=Gleimia coleocanis DSM 15436 TaxID=525245 RepID=C0W064_9ACTO|nr:ABC transporter ATP-binding protein [Gleimia coleocanis]EEH63923.1 ABC transporter, ATP-binding protein [Gleimia coleocanis DSM 15436]
MIELKNVTKTFKQGEEEIQALKNTNFTAQPGEFVAIIGPSGSGKSTFLTIIGGLQSASTGEVTLASQRVDTMNAKQRSQLRFEKLGFILQASSLVPFLRVEEQLLLHSKVAREKADKERQKMLLEQLGVAKLARKYPSELSGGERQRVAIATALMHNPDVILADEPTAALDTDRALETTRLLRDLTHEYQRTTVMVTHDRRLLEYCDRVYQIRDGVLEEKPELAGKQN